MEKILNEKIMGWVGSLSFIVFLASKYFFADNVFAQVFSFYESKVEFVLNFGLVVILLNIIVAALLFLGLPLFLISISDRLEKLKEGFFKKYFTRSFLYLSILIIIVSFVAYLEILSDKLNDQIFHFTPFLIPFLGFSLLYIHLDFLITSILKLTGFYINHDHDIKGTLV